MIVRDSIDNGNGQEWSGDGGDEELMIMVMIKAHANARNTVGQQDATLLGPTCCERLHTMLCAVVCCCDLLEVVG